MARRERSRQWGYVSNGTLASWSANGPARSLDGRPAASTVFRVQEWAARGRRGGALRDDSFGARRQQRWGVFSIKAGHTDATLSVCGSSYSLRG